MKKANKTRMKVIIKEVLIKERNEEIAKILREAESGPAGYDEEKAICIEDWERNFEQCRFQAILDISGVIETCDRTIRFYEEAINKWPST